MASAAFKRRRCLIPADGYYEWQKTGSRKRPYYIRLGDEQPFALAGLWESWEGGGAGPLETCTIITTEANDRTADVHPRMPVILEPQHHELWLDTTVDDRRRLEPLLKPYDSSAMKLDPVSTYVNNARHEGPEWQWHGNGQLKSWLDHVQAPWQLKAVWAHHRYVVASVDG